MAGPCIQHDANGPVFLEFDQFSLEMVELGRFAVNEHNKKQNSLLEFGKVINVKIELAIEVMHLITLEATDGGQKKVYEAKIRERTGMNNELINFKLISNA